MDLYQKHRKLNNFIGFMTRIMDASFRWHDNRWLILFFLFFIPIFCYAQIKVTDDLGNEVILQHPAQRIITLAPHLTEIVAAAGAERYLVGISSYSDFPTTLKNLPQVNTASELNLELILALRPDVILVWHGGNPAKQIEKLKALHIPIFYSQPRKLSDISHTMLKVGQLAQTELIAKEKARELETQFDRLKQKYAQAKKMKVFYQLAEKPLLTLNHTSLIHEVIVCCGGENIFAEAKGMVPMVNDEAILQADPDVIIAANANNLQRWSELQTLNAVKNKNLYAINPDILTRYGPRLIQGAERMCQNLQEAREKTLKK